MKDPFYDALVIPTGETTFGDKSFPVSSEAVKLFNTGHFGYIFVTGGYGGFSRVDPEDKESVSEARETLKFLSGNGIPRNSIYYDDQSFDTLGNFTYPIVQPLERNPNLSEFENILIIGQEGHLWRIKDYKEIIFPHKNRVSVYSVPGRHNDGLMAKLYHGGIMNALEKKYGEYPGAENVHEFLMKEHPFYSTGWYKKSPLTRKFKMGLKAVEWMRRK